MFMHSKSHWISVSHVVSALVSYSWVLLLRFIALVLKLGKDTALSLTFSIRWRIDTSTAIVLLQSINIPVKVGVIVEWLLLRIVSVSLLNKSDQRKGSVIIRRISVCGYICYHWQLTLPGRYSLHMSCVIQRHVHSPVAGSSSINCIFRTTVRGTVTVEMYETF